MLAQGKPFLFDAHQYSEKLCLSKGPALSKRVARVEGPCPEQARSARRRGPALSKHEVRVEGLTIEPVLSPRISHIAVAPIFPKTTLFIFPKLDLPNELRALPGI